MILKEERQSQLKLNGITIIRLCLSVCAPFQFSAEAKAIPVW